jgi:hypothetical protein
MRRARPLLLVIAVAAAATALLADVFRTLGGSAADRLSTIGGEAVYRSDATVNGEPAQITAFGFSGSPAERAADLSRALGIAPPQSAADALMITGASGSDLLHLLILPAHIDKTLAILITQKPPRTHRATEPIWPDLPRPANAELTFTATLAATRATLVTATVPSQPEAAAREMSGLMIAAGWALAAPPTRSFALYQRRQATCAVLSQPDDIPGVTRITLLQRIGKLQ